MLNSRITFSIPSLPKADNSLFNLLSHDMSTSDTYFDAFVSKYVTFVLNLSFHYLRLLSVIFAFHLARQFGAFIQQHQGNLFTMMTCTAFYSRRMYPVKKHAQQSPPLQRSKSDRSLVFQAQVQTLVTLQGNMEDSSPSLLTIIPQTTGTLAILFGG